MNQDTLVFNKEDFTKQSNSVSTLDFPFIHKCGDPLNTVKYSELDFIQNQNIIGQVAHGSSWLSFLTVFNNEIHAVSISKYDGEIIQDFILLTNSCPENQFKYLIIRRNTLTSILTATEEIDPLSLVEIKDISSKGVTSYIEYVMGTNGNWVE